MTSEEPFQWHFDLPFGYVVDAFYFVYIVCHLSALNTEYGLQVNTVVQIKSEAVTDTYSTCSSPYCSQK